MSKVQFKPRAVTEAIFVHCSATKASMNVGLREIRQWHKEQGWLDVGYHFIIRRDGTVEEGRPVGELAVVEISGQDRPGQGVDLGHHMHRHRRPVLAEDPLDVPGHRDRSRPARAVPYPDLPVLHGGLDRDVEGDRLGHADRDHRLGQRQGKARRRGGGERRPRLGFGAGSGSGKSSSSSKSSSSAGCGGARRPRLDGAGGGASSCLGGERRPRRADDQASGE